MIVSKPELGLADSSLLRQLGHSRRMRTVVHGTTRGELKSPIEIGIQKIIQEEKKWLTVEMAIASACICKAFDIKLFLVSEAE